MAAKGGYFRIDARWENSHEAPGAQDFFEVDQIGGSLDDAKSVAQTYLNRHAPPHARRIEWVEGESAAKCYYGRAPTITFRVTS